MMKIDLSKFTINQLLQYVNDILSHAGPVLVDKELAELKAIDDEFDRRDKCVEGTKEGSL